MTELITRDSSETIVLNSLPPAIHSPTAHPARTDRYQVINTRKIIDTLVADGFKLVSATVKRPRNHAKREVDLLHGRHQVALSLPGVMTAYGTEPRFLFDNSHDGSSRAVARIGAHVQVCSNGLVMYQDFARADFLHAGQQAHDVVKRIKNLARNVTPMFDQIERWTKKDLSMSARLEYARLASMLRWGDPHRFAPDDLLRVARAEEDKGDLWTVFNRVQEVTTRGASNGIALEGLSRSGRRATARPLTEIATATQFNADLWRLTDEFAQFA